MDNQLKRGGQMKKVISIILFIFFYLFIKFLLGDNIFDTKYFS